MILELAKSTLGLTFRAQGYDTNLMSNFYPFPPFQQRFGNEVDSKGNPVISAEWQTIINNSGQVSLDEASL